MASPLDKRGTITQLPSGSWRARLPGSIGGAGRRGSFTGRTYEEAAGWLAAALELAAAETPAPTGTLRAWGVTWLERRAARGLASADTDRGRWARLIDGSAPGDLALRSITPPRVAAWTRWLAVQPRLRQARGGEAGPHQLARALELAALLLREPAAAGRRAG